MTGTVADTTVHDYRQWARLAPVPVARKIPIRRHIPISLSPKRAIVTH